MKREVDRPSVARWGRGRVGGDGGENSSSQRERERKRGSNSASYSLIRNFYEGRKPIIRTFANFVIVEKTKFISR